jgi:hypothetical protein
MDVFAAKKLWMLIWIWFDPSYYWQSARPLSHDTFAGKMARNGVDNTRKRGKTLSRWVRNAPRSPPCTPRATGRTILYRDGSTYLALRP